ncbi:MAG: T9SS type A sorting domain-containing protein [Moraxellaceae bacterium]|jgi:hypothetical protein
MKKHITLLSGLLLASGLFAQVKSLQVTERQAKKIAVDYVAAEKPAIAPKALGTPFWTNNFSNPADWTVNNSGQTGGAAFGWSIDSIKDGWWAPATAIASTSEGKFAELSNGNPTLTPATQALNVTYTLTTAAPISLATAGTDISLQFLQFGARFNDLQQMLISTDGTTFTAVGDNNNYDVLSATGGAAYANPTTKTINLAPFLTSAATQVWIRFSWTTNYPNSATNPNVWVTYGWYIDDVKLVTNPDFDLSVTEDYWGTAGLNYFQIPTTQIAPIDFTANVFNGGTATMTNATLSVNVNTGAFTSVSTPVAIPALGTDSLVAATQFTPAGLGTYSFTRTISADSIDDVPANNTLPAVSFAVTNYTYARDNGTYVGNTSNGTDGFEVGNFFDIWNGQELKGITTRFATGTPAGTEIYVRLYEIDFATGDFLLLSESDIIPLTASMLNTNLTFLLQDAVQLEAGKTYLPVVGTYDPNLKVANAGISDKSTTFIFDRGVPSASDPEGTWFYQTGTPVVRMNFDPSLGISAMDNVTNLSIAPNPFAAATSIEFNLTAAAEVAVTVTDIAGRVVATVPASFMNEGVQSIAIDGSAFEAGIYNYTIQVGNAVTTKRVVKK